MKVSTDSIILGSWALSLVNCDDISTSIDNPICALDIGSGSGLLSLMLAQGFKGRIQVDAVELDASASQQGSENVAASPWPDAVISHCEDITRYSRQPTAEAFYKLIISNPPYFPEVSGSTKAYLKQTPIRKSARNQQSLSLKTLLSIISQMLSSQGHAFMTIPASELERVAKLATENGLSLSHCLRVKSNNQKAPYVMCLALCKPSVETQYSELIIYQSNNVYTLEYRTLCANFYRDF